MKIPYLWIHPGRHTPCAYYRRGSLRVRILDAHGRPLLPGQPGFLTAFAAVADRLVPKRTTAAGVIPGSLAALATAYRSSPEWRALAPGTRTDYGPVIDKLLPRYGHLPVKDMPRAAVFRIRDEYAVDAAGKPTPRRANKVVQVISLLMSWAINRGWRENNPALRPGRLTTGPGYTAWRPEQFAAFMLHPAVHEPIRRAAAVGWYTGLRSQDCRSLRQANRVDGAIVVTTGKTGAVAYIPEHPALTRMLDAATVTDYLLTRADGRPWTRDRFNHVFGQAVAAAGLIGLTFHGLRAGFSVTAAESGLTDAETEALVPHADPRMTRHYRRSADQQRLAAAGMAKMIKGRDGGQP